MTMAFFEADSSQAHANKQKYMPFDVQKQKSQSNSEHLADSDSVRPGMRFVVRNTKLPGA